MVVEGRSRTGDEAGWVGERVKIEEVGGWGGGGEGGGYRVSENQEAEVESLLSHPVFGFSRRAAI